MLVLSPDVCAHEEIFDSKSDGGKQSDYAPLRKREIISAMSIGGHRSVINQISTIKVIALATPKYNGPQRVLALYFMTDARKCWSSGIWSIVSRLF